MSEHEQAATPADAPETGAVATETAPSAAPESTENGAGSITDSSEAMEDLAPDGGTNDVVFDDLGSMSLSDAIDATLGGHVQAIDTNLGGYAKAIDGTIGQHAQKMNDAFDGRAKALDAKFDELLK